MLDGEIDIAEILTTGAVLQTARARLQAGNIPQAGLDARILVCHALGITHEELIARPELVASQAALGLLEKFLSRRMNHEPIARIIGRRDFWRGSFALDPATLDPRPDSEILIKAGLQCAAEITRQKQKTSEDSDLQILDLGTGTGCLLISLLMELPEAYGIGVDLSLEALHVARANAGFAGVDQRLSFMCGNWGAGLKRGFDLIVCNPPYIASNEIASLDRDVRDYDPILALDGGYDGLQAYRIILKQLAGLLNPNGWAVFEVGETQAEAVSGLFAQAEFSDRSGLPMQVCDLAGKKRCVRATGNGVLTII